MDQAELRREKLSRWNRFWDDMTLALFAFGFGVLATFVFFTLSR